MQPCLTISKSARTNGIPLFSYRISAAPPSVSDLKLTEEHRRSRRSYCRQPSQYPPLHAGSHEPDQQK